MAARGELVPVPDEESERQYNQVHTTLTEVGYDHYEISNFAREDRRSRHNSSYWQSQPYLGIGPAAHSFDGETRVWAVASVAEYLAGVDGGECYESEHLMAEAEGFVASGVLVSDGSRVAMCPERWLVSDSVIAELFVESEN